MILINYLKTFKSRKIHIFCVGTAKSGTHSMESIFNEKYRSAHEPSSTELIQLILDRANGSLTDREVYRYLRRRDKKLHLEVDSSQLNYFIIKYLLKLFPKSKYILTIRNPYCWLNSFINHQLTYETPKIWEKFREYRFSSGKYKYNDKERVLREKGLYTLDGYLSYWQRHNMDIINIIPKSKLLVISTNKINQSLDIIAEFCSISKYNLNKLKSHSYKSIKDHKILENIDHDYLVCKIDQHCHSLLREFFPEIRSGCAGGILSLHD